MQTNTHPAANSGRNRWPGTNQPMTLDECVRLVTCAESFEELTETLPAYAPKFYVKPTTSAERLAQRRIVASFNAWAERTGREARAFIAECAQ